MYCSKCGSQIRDKAKFCQNCGNPVDNNGNVSSVPTNVSTVTSTPAAKSSKSALVIIFIVIALIIIGFLAFFGIVFFIIFKVMSGIEENKFIEFQEYSVPTIYYVLDEKKSICTYNNYNYDESSSRVEIDYCGNLSEEELEDYFDYLVEEEGFEMYDGSYEKQFIKKLGHTVVTITVTDNKITYTEFFGDDLLVDKNGHIEM